ncbi:hypothetical protein GRF29_164g444297 [Pseudopithomyces chartarum]|uniref:Uncharacterized protein n=1 Tax=Pseudopithomyces chartarum TaxID=1892770 RepID=A0AAN6LPM2_9PLEO|nr:hypothetical protein GRF29_164g444297 [Pseudopithomyces chartarum]
MGVTISHATTAPLFMISTIIGFVSFAFTVGTFLKVSWQSILTIKSAPHEIHDYLSNLKQALLEERRHLRKVRKRMRRRGTTQAPNDYDDLNSGIDRHRSHSRRGRDRRNNIGGNMYAKGPRTYFERDEQAFRSQGESEALRVMRDAVRDMIRSFRVLEYPFLKPEFQDGDAAHWSTNTPAKEKSAKYLQSPPRSPYQDEEDADGDEGLGRSNRLGTEYRTCGLKERWLWLHRKSDVIAMSEGLAKIEVRRTAHEVGAVAMAVADIGRDVENMLESIRQMEGRLNRVVGVRRVE